MNDPIEDLAARIIASQKSTEAIIKEVARLALQVRHDWAGERPYIARLGESAQREKSLRDERIRRDFHDGETPKLISRREGISSERVRQIVGLAKPAAKRLP
jgi:hypothetical protein